MNSRIFQISLGILLGDASIQRNKGRSQEKWRLKILQGARHSPYVHHLWREFSPYVQAPPHTHQGRQCISFSTLFHQDFIPLARIFCAAGGRKGVGSYFLENAISPVSLAYWFADDGGLLCYNRDYPRRGVVLNTQGFLPEECQILLENLKQTYGFSCWCKANKGKTTIAFSGRDWPLISAVILPHLEETMWYKFPPLGRES